MKGLAGKAKTGIRHPWKLRQRARALRLEGKTHREIAKELSISISTAFIWTTDIRLTKEQQQSIKDRRRKPYSTPHQKKLLSDCLQKRLKKYWRDRMYTRSELLKKITHFVHNYGRIPLKREFNMYGEYKKRFGSWNKAIRAAGFLPNEVIFSKKYLSLDGHVCDSYAELVIDDWLCTHNVLHKRHFSYPGTKMTADFMVGDIVIEYFGLHGLTHEYDVNIIKKRALCQRFSLKLIEIYPTELFSKDFRECLDSVLKKIWANAFA